VGEFRFLETSALDPHPPPALLGPSETSMRIAAVDNRKVAVA